MMAANDSIRRRVGVLESVVDAEAQGWAYSNAGDVESLVIEFIVDGVTVGSCRPTLARPDVNWCLSERVRGFKFALPKDFGREQKSGWLTCRFAGDTASFWGAPLPIRPPSGYVGQVESFEGGMLRGWVYDRARPERPLCVAVYDGARLVTVAWTGDAQAGKMRHDGVEGAFRFSTKIFGCSSEQKSLYAVYVANTDFELKNSPLFDGLFASAPVSMGFDFIID